MEESLRLFVEKLKSFGVKPDDKFRFACFSDGIITYNLGKKKERRIELNFITDKECFPVENVKDLFFDPIRHIKYVDCGFYDNGEKITGFYFNTESNPMFNEE